MKVAKFDTFCASIAKAFGCLMGTKTRNSVSLHLNGKYLAECTDFGNGEWVCEFTDNYVCIGTHWITGLFWCYENGIGEHGGGPDDQISHRVGSLRAVINTAKKVHSNPVR